MVDASAAPAAPRMTAAAKAILVSVNISIFLVYSTRRPAKAGAPASHVMMQLMLPRSVIGQITVIRIVVVIVVVVVVRITVTAAVVVAVVSVGPVPIAVSETPVVIDVATRCRKVRATERPA